MRRAVFLVLSIGQLIGRRLTFDLSLHLERSTISSLYSLIKCLTSIGAYGDPETLCIISLSDVNKADSIYSADVWRAQGKFSRGSVRVVPIAVGISFPANADSIYPSAFSARRFIPVCFAGLRGLDKLYSRVI